MSFRIRVPRICKGVFLCVFADVEQDYSSLQKFSHNLDIRMNVASRLYVRAGGPGGQNATE